MKLLQKIIIFTTMTVLLSVAVVPVFDENAHAQSTNLIANSSFESPDSSATMPQAWQHDSWGTNTSSFKYLSVGHTGTKSAQTQITAYTSGDAKWVASPVAVTGGTSYIYSDAYMANTTTRLVAQYQDAMGNVTYDEFSAAEPSLNWKVYSSRITVPINATKVSMFHLISSVGLLTIDDASLTIAPVINPVPAGTNLIDNPSFETTNGSLPLSWSTDTWGNNSSSFAYTTNGHSGTKSATVNVAKYTSGDSKWLFAPITVAASTTYAYSDYNKSTVASNYVAEYRDVDGKLTYAFLGVAPASSVWTRNNVSFTTPASISTARVFHLINNVGTLNIDDVSMVQSSPAPAPNVSSNTIPNSSLEAVSSNDVTTPAEWYKSQYGNNSAEFTYNTNGHTGGRSGKVTVSNYINGGVNWAYGQQVVTGGKEYVFSDYYQSNVTTQALVAVKMQDGSLQYLWLGNAYVSDGGWTHFYRTITMPVGAVSAMAYHTVQSNGYLVTDDYDFEPYAPTGFNSPMVSITFDDGIASQSKNAIPILDQYSFKATFYISSGLLGLCDPNISTVCYMTAANVKSLSVNGNEIGSHTVMHPYLTSLTGNQLTSELQTSQDAIKNITGKLPTDFAAPYGDINLNVLTQVAHYYTSQRGVQIGYNLKNYYDQQNLLVQDINSSTTVEQFKSYVDHAKAINAWLIFMYHDISPTGTTDPGYNTSPNNFAIQMAYLAASGIPVKTIDQALPIANSQL